jgi:hypothetical protein
MLPNTIEYGEDETGVHVEGSVFGVAALLQRIAIGIATAILGWGFASAGYVPNASQSAATLAGMRATVAFVPLIFFALSCAAMLLNPLGRLSSPGFPGERDQRSWWRGLAQRCRRPLHRLRRSPSPANAGEEN